MGNIEVSTSVNGKWVLNNFNIYILFLFFLHIWGKLGYKQEL
ncbi:hypothetical protein MC7420_7530 [Coleofasciculus chthonoplastes PCC 7420]|uniref:Uncharacterized protein n=1 Tax=Coleofasciculus chthonoplastes PCC 7420 TaxID=118168 RepID=B4W1B4_9CYAN|nr:hypothetical protein MC7420_7530 [Coleofasciculus chthonoplastes PCC 7420]